MAEKAVLHVLCSRPARSHIVGSVHRLTAGGFELRYKSPVQIWDEDRQRFSVAAQDRTMRLDTDQPAGFSAYCETCGRRMFVPVDQILRSASHGIKSFQLQGRNSWARPRAAFLRLRRKAR